MFKTDLINQNKSIKDVHYTFILNLQISVHMRPSISRTSIADFSYATAHITSSLVLLYVLYSVLYKLIRIQYSKSSTVM